jgi:RNA polymerase sigma-70 factor (ECF subfamily)
MESIIKIAAFAGQSVKDFARKIVPIVIPDDQSLVLMSKEGNERAFGELVKRHQQFIIRQAYAYLGDNESAKDAAQEVFVKAYEGLPYLENDQVFKSWLYRICRNHCLNLARRRKIENGYQLDSPVAEKSNPGTKLILRKSIKRLDELSQEILILRYYNDLRYEEIAEFLNISLSSVKIRLFRAKNSLKAILGESNNELR